MLRNFLNVEEFPKSCRFLNHKISNLLLAIDLLFVVGIYMVILLAMYKRSKKRNLIIYIVACFICWLLPLIIVVGEGIGKVFGFVVVTLTGE